jgi:hypothetical protein
MNVKDIVTVAAAAAMKPAALVAAIVSNYQIARKAYLSNAVLMIELDKQVTEKTANAMLRKAGLSDSAIKNSRVMTRLSDAVVGPGHATMGWFVEVGFEEARAINAAITKVGVEKLVADKMFDRDAYKNFGEFEAVAETGMNRAERAVADQELADKKAAKTAEEAKTAAAVVEETTAAAEEETPPVATTLAPAAEAAKDAVAAKPPASPMAEFETLANAFEETAVSLIAKLGDPATTDAVRTRLQSVIKAVEAAVAVKAKAKK